jgi:DNA-binding MarR family transcriptional regulator
MKILDLVPRLREMSHEDLMNKIRGIRNARVYVTEHSQAKASKKPRKPREKKAEIEKLFAGMSPAEKAKLLEMLDES